MTMKLQADYKRAFKDADIRGIYPTEIDEEVAYLVARAFVDEFKYSQLVVGRDMRVSTPALHEAFLKGAADAGAGVIDVGLVTSPAFYFASGTLNLPGVMITASHSPKEYNGLKLVHAGAIPLTEKNGLKAVRQRIGRGQFIDAVTRGKLTKRNILPGFQKFVFKGYRAKKLAGMKIVADAGNGMAGVLMPLLAEKLPVKFDVMFGDLDGRFLNRGSDPTLAKHQGPIKARLREGSYDFGVAFDGDADRVAFLDETGKFINSAVIGALIAERLLKDHKDARVGYTGLTTRSYEEAIRAAGGKPMLMRVGHAFIKESMRQKDVLFACEHSGHFYYKDYFFTDSVTLTLLYVLDAYAEAKEQGLTFGQMMKPHLKYQQTEDVVVMVKDTKLALEKVESYINSLKPKSVKHFDGLTVDFGETWGAVKPSVTEYALKIMFEAKVKKVAQSMQDQLVAYVRTIAEDSR